MDVDAVWRDVAANVRGRVERDFPLGPLTTYRLGGSAALYVEPVDVDDLLTLAAALKDVSTDVLVVGRGSNLVVSDRGWPGVAIRLGTSFAWVRPDGTNGGVRAGAATSLPVVANWAARRGLAGLEFFVAIPGSVGGAVRMNAGAHGGSTADHLAAATVVSLRDGGVVQELDAAGLSFGYRESSVGPGDIVLEAAFSLPADSESSIRERMDSYRKRRAATQPPPVQNAGSVFRNPHGDSAGRLVEAAGLKGFRVGGASVSELHANFFIAGPDATAQDVYDLVHIVRDRVRDEKGVVLEPEIHFVGEFTSYARNQR